MVRARNELKQVTLDHGGLFYEVDDAEAASGIVKELEKDQVKEIGGNTEVRVTDVPQVAAVGLLAAVLVLLGLTAWRRV